MLNDLAVVTHLVSVQIKPKCGMTFEAMIFFFPSVLKFFFLNFTLK